jgi:hypothetical protein
MSIKLREKLERKVDAIEALEEKLYLALEGADIDTGLSVLTKLLCDVAIHNEVSKEKILAAIGITYEVFEVILETEAKVATKH